MTQAEAEKRYDAAEAKSRDRQTPNSIAATDKTAKELLHVAERDRALNRALAR